MIPDEYNLPPGCAPSNLPGNSRREIAVQRAMEKAGEKAEELAEELRALAHLLAPLDNDPSEAVRTFGVVIAATEDVANNLDDARHILGRVLE